MKIKNVKISKISAAHYIKLVFRSSLLLWAVITFLKYKSLQTISLKAAAPQYWPVLLFVYVVYIVEMIFRMFPSGIESMGCQKQFAVNYRPSPSAPNARVSGWDKTMIPVFLSWIGLNGIFAVLYYLHIIGDGMLFIIALIYSVSDMICILFFCPFQSWMMKNRCCTTCRIYNWDYLMMFTPLIFIKSWYTWSLAGVAFILFLRWELNAYIHPERFSEECNLNLRCVNCTEKLCSHKTQLADLWKKESTILKKQADILKRETEAIKTKLLDDNKTKNKEG